MKWNFWPYSARGAAFSFCSCVLLKKGETFVTRWLYNCKLDLPKVTLYFRLFISCTKIFSTFFETFIYVLYLLYNVFNSICQCILVSGVGWGAYGVNNYLCILRQSRRNETIKTFYFLLFPREKKPF